MKKTDDYDFHVESLQREIRLLKEANSIVKLANIEALASEADWKRRAERNRERALEAKKAWMVAAATKINPPIFLSDDAAKAKQDGYNDGVIATNLEFNKLFGRLYWRTKT